MVKGDAANVAVNFLLILPLVLSRCEPWCNEPTSGWAECAACGPRPTVRTASWTAGALRARAFLRAGFDAEGVVPTLAVGRLWSPLTPLRGARGRLFLCMRPGGRAVGMRHTYKSGGTALMHALRKECALVNRTKVVQVDSRTLLATLGELRSPPRSLFLFNAVRDPVERFISGLHELETRGWLRADPDDPSARVLQVTGVDEATNRSRVGELHRLPRLERPVSQLLALLLRERSYLNPHLTPQLHAFLVRPFYRHSGLTVRLPLDFIGRTEAMGETEQVHTQHAPTLSPPFPSGFLSCVCCHDIMPSHRH